MFKVGDNVEIILCDKSIRIKNRYKGMIGKINSLGINNYGDQVYRVDGNGLYFYEHELRLAKKSNKYKYIRGG